MSMDKSLKSQGELVRHRNVLTRAERVQTLKEEEKWQEDQDVFGLPKVAHRKVVTRKHKAEAAKPAAEAAAEAEAGPATEAAESEAPAAKSKA